MRCEDAKPDDGVIQEFEQVWLAQAEGASIPSAQQISPGQIAGLMPHLMLLEVVPDSAEPHFRTRLIGAAHRQVAQKLRAGDLLDEFDADHADRARIAASTGKSVYWSSNDGVGVSVGDFPFASDGHTVDRVVSVVVGGDKRRQFFSDLLGG